MEVHLRVLVCLLIPALATADNPLATVLPTNLPPTTIPYTTLNPNEGVPTKESVPKDPFASDNWGETHIKLLETNYTWTIANFTPYAKVEKFNGEFLESPTFTAPQNNRFNWSLVLYPHGTPGGSYDSMMSVFLNYKSGDLPSLKVIFRIVLLNATFHEYIEVPVRMELQRGEGGGTHSFINFWKVLDKNNGILKDDRLTLYTELVAVVSVQNFSSHCWAANQNRRQFSDDLRPLLDSGNFSDVRLVANDGEVSAHNAILSARSLLVALDPKESQRFYRIDTSVAALRNVLGYAYTGRYQIGNATEEFRLAIKYGIKGLEEIMEETLCLSLRIENAIDILYLAARNRSYKLRENAVNFIAAHMDYFIGTKEFKDLEKRDPELALEIYHALQRNKN